MRLNSPFSGLLLTMTLATAAAGKASIFAKIASLEASKSPLLQYPTQFTQAIIPKQIHSHNDCESRSFAGTPSPCSPLSLT